MKIKEDDLAILLGIAYRFGWCEGRYSWDRIDQILDGDEGRNDFDGITPEDLPAVRRLVSTATEHFLTRGKSVTELARKVFRLHEQKERDS